MGNILDPQLKGFSQSGIPSQLRLQIPHSGYHRMQGPAQIDRRWASCQQGGTGTLYIVQGWIPPYLLRQAECRGNPDQRGAAHLHGSDRMAVGLQGLQSAPLQSVGQQCLVDNLYSVGSRVPAQAT